MIYSYAMRVKGVEIIIRRELNLSYNIRLIILSFLFIFILTGCELSSQNGIQEVEENVIILINNEEVYLEEFEEIYNIAKNIRIFKDTDEAKAFALKILIEDKVQEQKIIELGIIATDEEARDMYEEIFKDEGLTFDEFLEKNTGLEERDYLNNTKEGIKIDRLYEMNTNISDEDLEPSEKVKIREEYLNTLIKDSKIGVQEEYLNLVPKEISVYKLKVRS